MTLNPNDPLQKLGVLLAQKARDPDIDGYKPLPHQVRFHSNPARGRINFGGNRSGKSYSSVCEMVWWATGTHPFRDTPRPPVALRHVAVDNPQGINKILKELYKKIVPSRYLRGGSWESAWQNSPPALFFSNGSFVEFMSYEQELDKHAGTSRHAIAFDEEPDEAIFNENMARLIDTDGEWWIAMTPVEGLTWVYTRFWLKYEEGELSEDVAIFVFLTDDNYYLPSGAFDRLMGDMSEEEKKARRTGAFIALSGLVYPFDQNVHVRDLEARRGLLTFTGMDHGLRNPTAWLWGQVDSDGVLYIVHEHYKSELYVKDHAAAVKAIEASNPLLVPSYRIGDPSIFNRNPLDGQSVGSEYATHGIYIGPGNNDVDAGINRLASMFYVHPDFGPKIYIDRSCRALIRELRTYRWDEWATRKAETQKEPKTKPKKKDDHAADALRYMAMTRPETDSGSGPIAPDPVPRIPGSQYPTDWEAYDHRNSGAYDDVMGSEW
jgi:phage terminase large subunit-like protein